MYRLTIILLLSLLPGLLPAEGELLKPDQAFKISSRSDGDNIVVRWDIADGYYLYRSKFRFDTDNPQVLLGSPDLPAGKIKQDPFFGEIEIYRDAVEAVIPVHPQGAEKPEILELEVRSQGCADIGICYPPHTQTLLVALDSSADQPPPVLASAAAEAEESLEQFGGTQVEGASSPAEAAPAPSPLEQLGALGDALGLDDEDGILPPEKAYQVIPRVIDGRTLKLDFKVADGTYLYEDKLQVKVEGEGLGLGELKLPRAKIKPDTIRTDGTIGDVAVFVHDFEVEVPLIRQKPEATTARVTVKYQGCAERGICYPPQKKSFELALPAVASADQPGSATATVARAPAATPALKTPPPAAVPADEQSEQDQIATMLKSGSTWLVMLSFFGIGLLLSFTPCVFPMIPILSGIIAGQGSRITTRRAFSLSLVFVLAMAVAYTLAGVLAGLFGANLQAAFQNPWILSFFALVFVALAFSMFGFYELQLPASWQSKLSEISNRQQGGQMSGVAVMGLLSALIVGPCVAPPLAGALIFIGQTGDWLLGGLALFAMSMGMGAPLIAIGTSAGRFLPKAGGWMDAVKAVFGVIMLGLAITMLERFLEPVVPMLLWGMLLIVSSIYMGALKQLPVEATGWSKLWKGLGVVLLVYGVLFLVGVAANGRDTLQPLRGLAIGGGTPAESHVSFRQIRNIADLERELAAARAEGRPVMLDFYADWCIYCKTLEKNVFPDPRVRAVMADWVLLQVDVTDQSEEQLAIQERFSVPAPPALIFWNRQGEELRNLRIMGEIDAEELARHAARVMQ